MVRKGTNGDLLLYDNDMQITEAVIQAALRNSSGKHVVELLFKRNGVHTTAALVEGAVKNSRISVATLKLCLYNLPVEYVLTAALATKKFSKLMPIAIHKGHETLACLLIENGADLTARDDNGKTAHRIAAENGHETIVLFY